MTDVALIGCILFTDVALIGGMLYVGITIVVFVRMAVAMGMEMISGGRCMASVVVQGLWNLDLRAHAHGTRDLWTIITEPAMEPTLKKLVERASAQGYTIEDVAYGWGTHDSRTGPHESGQNSKMLLIVSEPMAQIILQEMERTLRKHYAITAFRHEHAIEVLNHKPMMLESEVRQPALGRI